MMLNEFGSGPERKGALDKLRQEQEGIISSQQETKTNQTPTKAKPRPRTSMEQVAASARQELEKSVLEAREGKTTEEDPKLPEEAASSLDSMMSAWAKTGNPDQVLKPQAQEITESVENQEAEVEEEVLKKPIEAGPSSSRKETKVTRGKTEVVDLEPKKMVETNEKASQEEKVKVTNNELKKKKEIRTPQERLERLQEIGKQEKEETVPKENLPDLSPDLEKSEKSANPDIPEL